MQPKWRTKSAFPKTDVEWATYYPLIGRTVEGEASVKKQFLRSNVMEPALVCSPKTDGIFLPPILAGDARQFEDRITRLLGQMWKMSLIVFVLTVIAYMALDAPLELMGILVVAVFPLIVFQFWNDRYVQDNPGVITERWLFASWIYLQRGSLAYIFPALMLMFGASQVIAIYMGLPHETVLQNFGMAYQQFSEGEYWRMASGVFLHSSLAHWLTNFFIGSGVWLLATRIFGSSSLVIMLCSAVFSFLFVFEISRFSLFEESVGIVGISGGISGLLGAVYGSSLRWKGLYPQRFHWSVGIFSAICLVLFVWALSPLSAMCHLAGFVVGGLIGGISDLALKGLAVFRVDDEDLLTTNVA